MSRNETQVPRSSAEAASATAGVTAPPTLIVPQAETAPGTAKVTWLGDPFDATEENVWMGYTFPKGEAVSVKDNPVLIAKARANRFFKVA